MNRKLTTPFPRAHTVCSSRTVAGLIMLLGSMLLSSGRLSAQDWAVRDEHGKTVRLEDYRGRWVLVNFWATWCSPCLGEIPLLSRLQQEHSELSILGIAIMVRKKKDVFEYATRHAIPYRVIPGDEGSASAFGGIDELPTSFLYAPDGSLVLKQIGTIDAAAVEKLLSSRKK